MAYTLAVMRPDREPEVSATPTRATTLRLLAGLYRQADAAYAPFSCPASGECCNLARTGRPPYLWTPEWDALRAALERTGRTMPPARADGGCPFLDDSGKRCSVYADRPFGCRTFFCERIRGPAKQPLEAVVRISRKLEELSVAVDPELQAPRSILDWHAREPAR